MKKNLAFFIAISLLTIGCQNRTNDPYVIMDEYYSRLKISYDVIEIDMADSTNLKALFWDSGNRVSQAGIAVIPPPNIAPMLNRKLLLNEKEIPVVINAIANKRGALAMCDEYNQPIIYLPKKDDKRISPYALVFFRFHEYAHHLLGHTACTRGVKLTSKEEIMADCFASDMLENEFGQDGVAIIHHMSGTLNGINRSADGHYPSSQERAELLYSMQKCEERTQGQR